MIVDMGYETGGLRQGGSSADDATRYGRINYGLDNELFHLVEATVPRSFADGLYGGTADRMAFRSVDAGAQLDELNRVARVHAEWLPDPPSSCAQARASRDGLS